MYGNFCLDRVGRFCRLSHEEGRQNEADWFWPP
jgi:hypothetical protein